MYTAQRYQQVVNVNSFIYVQYIISVVPIISQRCVSERSVVAKTNKQFIQTINTNVSIFLQQHTYQPPQRIQRRG